MAKHMNIDDKRDHTLWYMIEPKLVDHVYKHEKLGYPDVLHPFVEWLLDQDREGYFTCSFKTNQYMGPVTPAAALGRGPMPVLQTYVEWARFYISHPHTAFEFRLRWS